MNILVEGTRGKSGLVKMITEILDKREISVVGKITGLETAIFFKGERILIPRKRGKFLLDFENKTILKKYKECSVKVFENQAISTYTMRVVHNLFKPDFILIPNIRYEHQDQLGEDILEIAKNFAVNFKNIKKIITTENKKEVLDVFKKYAKKYHAKLIVVKTNEDIPGKEVIHLIDVFLKIAFNKGLDIHEKNFLLSQINGKIEVGFDSAKKIHFFKGSKINDIESAKNVFNLLKKNSGKKFCFVCYFRKDRQERTKAFRPLIEEWLNDTAVSFVYYSGSHKNYLKKHPKLEYFKEEDINKLYTYCRKTSSILYTAINGVNKIIKKIEGELVDSGL